MGMTGSSAQWKDNSSKAKWSFVFEEKVPTQLSYVESNGDQVAGPWGHECATLQRAVVRDRLNLILARTTTKFCGGRYHRPTLLLAKEIARWVSDYLQKLCAAIIQQINEVIKSDCTEHEIHWNFSRPGSWSAATHLDFKCLAGQAVLSNITATDKVKVLSDFTERNASAMVLLTNERVDDKCGFSIGNRIITCDIGGATTDIAVAYIDKAGVLITMEQEVENLLGFVTMEQSFWEHMRNALKSAKVHCAEKVALDFARSDSFLEACKVVGARGDNDWFEFVLLDYFEKNWESPSDTTSYATFIRNSKVYIHRETIISFFDHLIEQIQTAIDNVRTKLEPAHSASRIGFCGGASQFMYCMDLLRLRYQGIVPVFAFNPVGYGPEMATVVGSARLWDQSLIKEFALNTLIGVMFGDTMSWNVGSKSLESPSSDVPFRWTASLFGNESRRSHRIQICAIPKIAENPRTLKEDV